MQRNLLKGIIIISAVALSSCSTMNKLSKQDNIGDDVYNTKAKAGDEFEYFAQTPTPQPQINYVRNDDYYYYGDYESRINRFAYLSPFDYDDDFYYSYAPNNGYYNQPPVVAANAAPVVDDGYYYDPAYDFGVYDAFDFGFGYYGGYDNFGYGNAYSTFIYGGGSRYGRGKRSYSHSNNAGGNTAGGLVFTRVGRGNGGFGGTAVNSGGSLGLVFTRGGATTGANIASYVGARPGGSNAVYPGRPGTNSITSNAVGTVNNNNSAQRYVRPQSENPRPQTQTYQPTMSRPSSTSSSSSSSGGGGGGNASGGGGRPVRP